MLQVLHNLMPSLCSSEGNQQLPGARQFAIDQIGGRVCLQGLFQVRSGLLDLPARPVSGVFRAVEIACKACFRCVQGWFDGFPGQLSWTHPSLASHSSTYSCQQHKLQINMALLR